MDKQLWRKKLERIQRRIAIRICSAYRTISYEAALASWVERRHGEIGYHLTQAVSGHGSFREYMYRIGKVEDDECIYCGEWDGLEHTIFRCPRWRETRERWEEETGTAIDPENMIATMLESEEKWLRIEEGVRKIMMEKEQEEREIR